MGVGGGGDKGGKAGLHGRERKGVYTGSERNHFTGEKSGKRMARAVGVSADQGVHSRTSLFRILPPELATVRVASPRPRHTACVFMLLHHVVMCTSGC